MFGLTVITSLSFVRCRAGQIWCSFECQYIHTASTYLAQLTSHRGYLPLVEFSTTFPKNLGVTVTAGRQYLSLAQANLILPAAIELLPEFKDDSRYNGTVMLVEALVKRQHPLWRYNNAMTLTVWACPSGLDDVDLKVPCWNGLHAAHCCTTVLYYRCSVLALAHLQLSHATLVSLSWRGTELSYDHRTNQSAERQFSERQQSSYR